MSTSERTRDRTEHESGNARRRFRQAAGHLRRNAETSGLRRRTLLLRSLLVADGLSLIIAFAISQALVQWTGGDSLNEWAVVAVFAAALPAWFLIGTLLGLYDRDHERPDHSTVDDLGALFNMVTIGSWLFLVMLWVTGAEEAEPLPVVLLWAVAFPVTVLMRRTTRLIVRRRTSFGQNAVIVGAKDVGQLVAAKIMRQPRYGINVVGFVDSEPATLPDDLQHLAILGTPDQLPELIEVLDVERVILAFSPTGDKVTIELVRWLRKADVQVDIVPRLFETYGTRVGVHWIEGLPLIGLPAVRLSPPALALKRAVDVALSLAALTVLSPVLAVLALLVKRDTPGPAFYGHERLGRDGRRIRVFKFRTMGLEYCLGPEYGGDSAQAEFQRLMDDRALREEFERSHKLEHDPRVTRVGAFLRRTSLDELPQLINVLRGDLSLVGPRPITQDELPRYGAGAEALLKVRPGLTGFWQISGRSATSYEERVMLDMAYVASWSFKSDLVLLAKTFGKALASQPGAH